VRLVALALLLIVSAACSGGENGDDGGSPSPGRLTGANGPTAAGGTGGAEPTAAPGQMGPTGPVPDACSLIAPEEIEAITGTNPGTGSTSGSEERSICIYQNGWITAVEWAANYEASKAIIEAESEIEPVSGVGVEAFWDPAGQLVALGERSFVGVTIGTGRKAREQAARIAAAMLQGL
jgi:hypothetical protein